MDCVKRCKEVFETEIAELQKVACRIGDEFCEAVDLIFHAKGKVVVTGIGKTGIIGHKIASTLSSTGTSAVFMNAAEAMHGDLGVLCSHDVVIAISNSGASQEVLNILPLIKQMGCKVIVMTGSLDSELARGADVVLDCGVEHEASSDGLAPTCSTTAALVMGDALAMCLKERKEFLPEHFKFLHPGGALGRPLFTRVKECMSERVPKVQECDAFADVVATVSEFAQGMTLVFEGDCATGIITDGDIRRAVQSNSQLDSIKAKDIMTKGYKQISPDTMITDALKVMNKNKITSLVVVDDKHHSCPIKGILHIHNVFDFK